ncbi:flagellin [Psychrobacillus psychrotolerans]|uniref:Flagellin n=1 Tax=Psychrobacillus psychrotolerans TaxID=126156 RepID=A0A1I5ZAS8_9BACI|nr:flagellin [Psychrobacillus psychrotolerans]SFQ53478.1 flagellin [Psychrobacillus psychrotolerans]
MRINHNIAAINTHRQLGAANNNQSKSMEKLSSGLRINRAGDDAAGLAISEKMRAQVRGLDQASSNAQDGISMIQTAEGALGETHSILQRMRELAVQSSNDTNTDSDRSEIQKEVDQLASEVTRIANNTEFNTQKLLNGGITQEGLGENTFHIGANAGQKIDISISAMDAKSLGISRDANTATAAGAGSVSTATVANSFGPQIADGNVIQLNYTAAIDAEAATSAVKTGGALTGTLDMTGAVSIELGGETVALDDVKLLGANFDSDNDAADLQAALQADIDSVTALAGKYNVGLTSDNKITITHIEKTGTDSEVDLTASNAGTLTLLGLDDTAVNGDAAVTAESAKVTLTGTTGTTAVQSVNVKDTDTSFTVAAGDFKGLTVNLAGAASTLTNTGTADTVTLSTTATSASSASFSGGAKMADAVTTAGIDVSSKESANSAITVINKAIETVSAERSKLGAVQNRLDHTINNLGTSSENLTAAESRIRDVDMAKEMMNQTKESILAQASQAMLAQANQKPQAVLQLLQ